MGLEGEPPPWQKLVRAPAVRVVGFEPVEEECAKLNARAAPGHVFLPCFVGDGTERTFHLCSHPMTSSLYEPNTPLLARFNNLEELTRPVRSTKVLTRRLDDIPEVESIDYLKVDVQGAELDVLRGGRARLASALVIETEVEFVPLYRDQPLFADVDRELREQGFVFHTFRGVAGRSLKPLLVGGDPNALGRQLLWADAVYVRDFMRLGSLEPAALLKYAAIVHDLYGSADLAALALQHHDARTGQGLWRIFMKRLLGTVPEAPPLP